MVYPITRLPVKVELQLAGVWTDVTAYTRVADKIGIVRGRRDEAGSFEPGELALVLNNQAGRFSPRNPMGPYYGALTRNTPIRVSVLAGTAMTRLLTPTDLTDYASAPDSAGLSVTGDLDIRVDLTMASAATQRRLVRKFGAPQSSYSLQVVETGIVRLFWSSDGTANQFADSTIPLQRTTGRMAIRSTMDVNNGAGGYTVTFYTADTIAGPWVQLGASVVQAGPTSIFDSTSPVEIGHTAAGSQIYAAEIRNGLAGTVVASPTFTSQTAGATSFADAQGNTWTLQGAAALSDRRYRFYGEVSSWPQQWDISERDAWVPISAAGVLRRLGQGTAPLEGPIQRYTAADPNVRGYWPMEDAQGSTSIASGLPSAPAMTIVGAPELASSDAFEVSAPLPVLVTGSGFGGSVNPYSSTGVIHARCLMANPAGGDTDNGIIMRIFTTGTAARWDYVYNTGGALTLKMYDSAGVLLNAEAVGYQNNGRLLVLIVELVQNGANIDYKMLTRDVVVGGGLQHTNTLASRTVGAATSIEINPGGLLNGTVIGHVAVTSGIPSFGADLPLRGYAGEKAGFRVARLCSEQGIPFTGLGNLDDSAAMGVQKPEQLLDLFAECEASDLGQLFESRDQLGLAYRTRASRAVQIPALALAYTALRELTPVEDDQNTRNDITVSRVNGSSARATVDTGPLSTQAPPNGVGRYDDQVELSLASDTQLADQANLRATLGTIDEPRYPVLSVQLAGTAFAASQALISSALDVEHGDRITVTGTPVWVPPGTIDQHTIGQVETLGVREYQIDYVCQPATPVGAAGLYDSSTSRWAADGATLNGAITSTATGAAALSLVTPVGKLLWTSDPAHFPLDIVVGGERITLSAIANTGSPQSATVSARSVNGVVKAHSAGESVQIADPDYYAL